MNILTKLNRWLVRKLPVIALAALLAGCGPDEWIVWAPDGEHAIVRDGTSRIIDSAGNPVPIAIGEHESIAAWLPDSRRVLVMRAVEVQSWDEYAQLLGVDRAGVIAQFGDGLARLVANYRGALAEFDSSPAFKIWKDNVDARGEGIDSAMYYLNCTQPGLLEPLVKAYAEKEAAAQRAKGDPAAGASETKISADSFTPQIRELHIRSIAAAGASDDQLLLRSASDIGALAVSPGGRAVAFVQDEPDNFRLYVLALEAGAFPVLVDAGAEFAAWSPDGQDLAYSKSGIPRRTQKGEFRLGSIARRRVCTPDGEIIAEAEASEDLAGLILPEYPARVAWLPDGRILFAGAKFTLPATTQSTPNALTLFALRQQPEPSIEQLISDTVPSRLTERVNFFSVSPDGKKVAILGKSGAVSVLNLENKSLGTLQDTFPPSAAKSNDDSMLVPAWRNSEELTFLVPAGDRAGSPARAEVVIASLRGGRRVISKSWLDSANLPRLEK